MERLALVIENPTKTDLLAECRKGNRDAMHTLYVEYQRRVFSIALNFFSGNAEQAEDVTQQVFLKLFKNSDFRGDSALTTWIYRMTVNACIDEIRKTRRFLNFGDWFKFAEPEAKFSLNDQLHSRQISAEVQAVVASLKPKYRLPILLKYVEGLSYQEIADVLECSIGTVSSRLNRGHKMLAVKLGHLRNEI
ncbi:MAG: RNA polymerase sigma factor [Blastocatellia bacterium]